MSAPVVGASGGAGRAIGKPADNSSLLNSLIQVLAVLKGFRGRFDEEFDPMTASSGKTPISTALAAIFRQIQEAQENQIVRADSLRVALATLHGHDMRLQMNTMDDAILCYAAVMQHLVSELNAAGNPALPAVFNDTFLMAIAGANGQPSGRFTVTVPSAALLDPGMRGAAMFTPEQIDRITAVNLTETLAKYNLPNHRNRLIDFGSLVGAILRALGGNTPPALVNMPLNLTFGISWGDVTPSLEDIKAVLAAISPVISEADIFDVSRQDTSAADAAAKPKETKKKGLFSRILGGGAADKDRDEDAEIEEAIVPSRYMALRGMIAYHGQHYVGFYYNADRKIWLFHDNTRVSKVGPNFSDIITKVGRGRYQPVLLFYESVSANAARNTLREFVSRRFSRRDESLFGHLENMDLQVPSKVRGRLCGMQRVGV